SSPLPSIIMHDYDGLYDHNSIGLGHHDVAMASSGMTSTTSTSSLSSSGTHSNNSNKRRQQHPSPSNPRYKCMHVKCSYSYSHSSGRSNHYTTYHTEPCKEQCKHCDLVKKKLSTKKVKCRHEVSCNKDLSTSNRANHEKNLKMHTKCSAMCAICREIRSKERRGTDGGNGGNGGNGGGSCGHGHGHPDIGSGN
ncbi:hypothetical protein SAMD00019534_018810, partial [Acytostelium subglobosum LB1]|uniref:hypothetical protein n=1 Tax=Acytostelium subglobosum LB1 TaxID=1410327 RepID=UPI000644A565